MIRYQKDDLRYDNVEMPIPNPQGNLVGSLVGNDQHYILLDIDIPHEYAPSKTEGHAHLILKPKVPISEEEYVQLLETLHALGVLQAGFINQISHYRQTFLAMGEHME